MPLAIVTYLGLDNRFSQVSILKTCLVFYTMDLRKNSLNPFLGPSSVHRSCPTRASMSIKLVKEFNFRKWSFENRL